jgi:hypothetical protein
MQAIGNRQFETPAKAEDQSRIRRLADRDGSRQYLALSQAQGEAGNQVQVMLHLPDAQ